MAVSYTAYVDGIGQPYMREVILHIADSFSLFYEKIFLVIRMQPIGQNLKNLTIC